MMKIKKMEKWMRNKKKQSHGAVPGPAKRLNRVHRGNVATGRRPSTAAASIELLKLRTKPRICRAFHVAATVDGRGPGAFSRPGMGAVPSFTRLNRISVNKIVKNIKNMQKRQFSCSQVEMGLPSQVCAGEGEAHGIGPAIPVSNEKRKNGLFAPSARKEVSSQVPGGESEAHDNGPAVPLSNE